MTTPTTNECLIQKNTDYTKINDWIVSVKLPKELTCDLREHLSSILNKQADAFYKLELYLGYKLTDEINYALLCTRKTTNPMEEKLYIVIVNNVRIIDLISIEAKRIIRYEDECPFDFCSCYKHKGVESGIPLYYYLTNRDLRAVYSYENSMPIRISISALNTLYNKIKSYFKPIDCTTGYSSKGLKDYPTAVNDNITDYQLSTSS